MMGLLDNNWICGVFPPVVMVISTEDFTTELSLLIRSVDGHVLSHEEILCFVND